MYNPADAASRTGVPTLTLLGVDHAAVQDGMRRELRCYDPGPLGPPVTTILFARRCPLGPWNRAVLPSISVVSLPGGAAVARHHILIRG
eukprot:gene349-9280_t